MKQRKQSLKKSLTYFIIVCWVTPLLFFSYFILITYKNIYTERTWWLINSGIMGTTTLVGSRVDNMIRTAQQPSYERNWEYAWQKYKRGEIGRTELFMELNYSMRFQYRTDQRFDEYAFYLEGESEPFCYNSKTTNAWEQNSEACNAVSASIREKDTSYIQLKEYNNNLYLVRNLYSVSDYTKFGTLVLSVNREILFDGFPMNEKDYVVVGFNDTDYIYYNPDMRTTLAQEQELLFNELQEKTKDMQLKNVYEEKGKNYDGHVFSKMRDQYKVSIYYMPSHEEIYKGLYPFYDMLGIMLSTFVLLILYVLYFLQNKIEEPLDTLVQTSKKIAEGELGVTIEEKTMPNKEFEEVVHYFNKMSERLKYLFDTVYSEKLARKDAQLAALQAQINPHFLNNTLEMMNWQARMNQDITVSKMIEALGTVLEYTMNRENAREASLSEEIHCVESYLYIMSMRFGQRMRVEREIDGEILQIQVPQLILQPLMENAILHGVEKSQSGTIWLKVHHDEEYIYLDILNTVSKIGEAELNRIQDILEGRNKLLEKGPGRHTSIGIWNVNKRIKLMFGERYGLTITLQEDNRILSRITLPYGENAQKEKNYREKSIRDELKKMKESSSLTN